MDSQSPAHAPYPFGVYTKTIARSPVILWILYARIRNHQHKDVVFVGEDFIHLKQVGSQGDIQHVATKADFDARIRDAKVFDNEDDEANQDFLVKLEKDRTASSLSGCPPQLLVLTLDSNDLVFVYCRSNTSESPYFVQQVVPMPSFDRILFQPGQHLAVDPHSRALAVAASEREVILYSMKPKSQIQQEIKTELPDWCPVSTQRTLQVEGVIHHLAFLNPPSDDQDHVIVLLVVTDQRRTKAVLVGWRYSLGLMHTELHSTQPINTRRKIPNLLIPLRDANFLLVTGDEITQYKDILSGSASDFELSTPSQGPRYPGNSPRSPIWVSWARPRRSRAATREKDFIYLVREDGLVCLYEFGLRNSIRTSDAGDVACHVGTAFASLGDEGDPDILAVAGETSSGSVVSIGRWPTTSPLEELSRHDTMMFHPIHTLRNWASVTDTVCCKRLQSSRALASNSDALFVTSGRQPFGCVTQLQNGLEAQLLAIVPLELFRYATDIWALPNGAKGTVVLVLSLPDGCKLFELAADLSEMDDGETFPISALDVSQRTLLAGFTASSHIVQITVRGICTSSSFHANFEDTSKIELDNENSILLAALVPEVAVAITAELHGGSHQICYYSLSSSEGEPAIQQQSFFNIDSTPLCLAAMSCSDGIISCVANEDGRFTLMKFDAHGIVGVTSDTELTPGVDEPTICDNLLILEYPAGENKIANLLVLCGLRDGRLITFELKPDHYHKPLNVRTIDLGYSTVKLVQLASNPSAAIAMTGSQTCLLRWDQNEPRSLQVLNIWAVDKERPAYMQGPVVAATQFPSTTYLTSDIAAESLIMISSGDLLIAHLDPVQTTVAHQIPVNGTPNRLIHSESLRSLVCSALCSTVRTLSSRSPTAPVEIRQISPVIEFIPDRGGENYSYSMQPGERVHALLEWTYRPGDEKTYSHILVGGSYVRKNGTRRGKVTFLQPSNRNWEVIDITERSRDIFDDDVYALALYDHVTYVACAGEKVYVKRYDRKWQDICPAFKLASPGVHVTVETDHSGQQAIVISTMRDSIVTLKLAEIMVPADASSAFGFELRPLIMGPRADTLIHHIVLDMALMPHGKNEIDQLVLMSTRRSQLLAMTSQKRDNTSPAQVGQLIFEAQLPCSLTRLTKTEPTKRKGAPPKGVIKQHFTGSCTNGALVGIVLLEPSLWRRLSWLQRLIEWSEELSPHSFVSPAYRTVNMVEPLGGRDRGLPIGLEGRAGDLAVLQTNKDKLQDMHIDGDILVRVFHPNGRQALTRVLQGLAEQEDGTGTWVREHMDQELIHLAELIEIVTQLDSWM